jgi:cyclopropane fatty-acyl-phospholipid synthase-like methyltransferase
MAFTVTRDTLENNGILFIRDVLRTNLTDPKGGRTAASWILKSPVKNQESDIPVIVLDQSSCTETRVTFRDAFSIEYNLGLMVWADTLERRDNIADAIKVLLQDDSKGDGTRSLYQQGLIYKDCESKNSDGYVQGYSELIRIKEMTITFQYIR